MLWTADTVMYRGVSMDAAYSGSTLIWKKQVPINGTLVTDMSQIDSASTYVLVYPINDTTGYIGLRSGLKTTTALTHMYVSEVSLSGDTLDGYTTDDVLKLKISSRYSYDDGWYHLKDVSTDYYLAYYDDVGVVSITRPYLSQEAIVHYKDMIFQITKSVYHHSSGHIEDLKGYTVRFGNSNQSYERPTPTGGIWKYLAGTAPDEFTYRVATAAGQEIPMLYKLK